IDRTILSSMQGTRKTTSWWQPNTIRTARSPSPWVPLVFGPMERLNSSEAISLAPFLSSAAEESVIERLTDHSDLGVLARSPLPSRPRRGGPYRRRSRRKQGTHRRTARAHPRPKRRKGRLSTALVPSEQFSALPVAATHPSPPLER